jgi:hypothetical protein
MRDPTLIGPWIRRFLLEHLITDRNFAHMLSDKWNGRLPPTQAVMMNQSEGGMQMLCAAVIDCEIAWIERQLTDALEARRVHAGVRPDGLPRFRSAQIAPADRSSAGWFGLQNVDGCEVDVAQQRSGFSQPNGIDVPKWKG